MRKLTVTTFAVAAVISAGAGASAALAAGTSQSRPAAAEHVSADRHATHAGRDRSGSRDSPSSTRHETLRQRAMERTHGAKAGS